MQVHLIAADRNRVPVSYLAKLTSWGISWTIREKRYEQDRREAEYDFISRITAEARSEYGDTIDFVQVLFDEADWPLSSGVKGKQYYAFFNDYQVAIVRDYGKLVAGTAEHEFMHSADNFCWTYTGVDLAKIVGVEDWDDDVVHRRKPKGVGYLNNYDDVFPIIRPFLEAAIAQRRRVQKITSLKIALERLMVELRRLQVAGRAPEELPEAPESAPNAPESHAPAKPAPTPIRTAQRLYEAAYGCIGKDMSDRAPDNLGCADSVNNIHELAFGFEIGGGTSTYELDRALAKDKRFQKVSGTPQAGDIIMSPSGHSTKGAKNGHVGIAGKNKAPDGTPWLMSNDSFKGTWEANYTFKSWKAYFGTKLGFPVHIYRLV